MTMTTEAAPHLLIAQHFMARKGLGDLRPIEVEEHESVPHCWYLYYELPQGQLELEVFYDVQKDDWEVAVTAFPVAL